MPPNSRCYNNLVSSDPLNLQTVDKKGKSNKILNISRTERALEFLKRLLSLNYQK